MRTYIGRFFILIVLLIASSMDSTSQIKAMKVIHFNEGIWINQLSISPDETMMAVSGTSPGIPGIWDIESGKQIRNFSHPDQNSEGYDKVDGSLCVTFSPDGKMVAIGYAGTAMGWGDTLLWDIESGKQIQRYRIDYNINYVFPADYDTNSICFNQEMTRLYTYTQSQYLREWDIQNGNLIRKLQIGYSGTMTILPDEKRFLMSGTGIFSLDSGKILFDFESLPKISKDKKTIYTFRTKSENQKEQAHMIEWNADDYTIIHEYPWFITREGVRLCA